MKFRKKQDIVEAEQWFAHKPVAGVEMHNFGSYFSCYQPGVKTDHYQWDKVNEGDWIVTDIGGSRSVWKSEDFEQTFEPVPRVTLVYCYDWSGLYVKGALVEEGHRATQVHVLEDLGFEVEIRNISPSFMFDRK
jgi:hypothetical protein